VTRSQLDQCNFAGLSEKHVARRWCSEKWMQRISHNQQTGTYNLRSSYFVDELLFVDVRPVVYSRKPANSSTFRWLTGYFDIWKASPRRSWCFSDAPNGVNFVTCILLRYSVDMSRSGIRLAYYDLKTLFVLVISCSFIKRWAHFVKDICPKTTPTNVSFATKGTVMPLAGALAPLLRHKCFDLRRRAVVIVRS